MSFRARLSLFFAIIVVIPMAAVALVLFTITADSETGKVDARLAEGMRTALTLYDDARRQARPALRLVARDPGVEAALARDRVGAARVRFRRLAAASPAIASIVLYDTRDRAVARAGAGRTVAPATAAPTSARGRRLGTLAVSVTRATAYAGEVERLTGLEVRVFVGESRIVSTLGGRDRAGPDSGTVEIDGQTYRGRFQEVAAPGGPPVMVGLLDRADDLSGAITESRLLVGGILLGFLLLSLVSSVFVVRALQSQVDQFLQAARRLGHGDFSHPVPVDGSDEFAALGTEFNKMSSELEAKIEEVERKRRELEGSIRRIGEAFARGLDRQGLIELAVRTAVDACAAEAGRALTLDRQKMRSAFIGSDEAALRAAIEAAERKAFEIREEDGEELLAVLDTSRKPGAPRAVSRGGADSAHALTAPLRARLGTGTEVQYVGALSIARRGEEFSDADRDLFAYLAGQAAVSIENADLHETVQLQAVTDELTGLANQRQFHEALDDELERSGRFGGDVGLVMLDLDDFKQVNDTFGHQQGDVVLSEVSSVLRDLSRDIDVPVRYGGEEMAVILPQTDISGAELAAERMRAAIGRLRIPRLDGKGTLRVTASFGVATVRADASVRDGHEREKDALVASADAALYRAKRAGKNRVERELPSPAPR